MQGELRVYVPATQPCAGEMQQGRRALDSVRGKVIGFVDNAKPNFNFLVEDLGRLLVERYGVAGIVTHRKPGQVPLEDGVLEDLKARCDAVITGSGD